MVNVGVEGGTWNLKMKLPVQYSNDVMRSQVIRSTSKILARDAIVFISSVINDMKFVLKRKEKYYFNIFDAAVVWLVIR